MVNLRVIVSRVIYLLSYLFDLYRFFSGVDTSDRLTKVKSIPIVSQSGRKWVFVENIGVF